MTNLKSVPVPDKKYIIKDIGDDIILISEKENLIHTLDEVGAAIWKNIDGKNNIAVILENICNEFEVDKKKAEYDIFSFIDKLKQKGLIEIK